MKPFRVLVVDASRATRAILAAVLFAEGDMEVVGSAGTGSAALSALSKCNPTVVMLDVEMADMRGLELLAEIRRRAPKIPVVVFSALTVKAGSITLDALGRGATDYVTKPASDASDEAMADHIRKELVGKLRGLGRRASAQFLAPELRAMRPVDDGTPLQVLAVGSSTGGPNALAQIFRSLLVPLAVPILVVQHMPPVFTRLLAERLSEVSPMPFREAEHGDVLVPGEGLVAPGGFHMRLERTSGRVSVTLDQAAPENSCRPAVDVLFRAVAAVYGAHALALVLTGMGRDGLRGAEELRRRGAQILAQDEATSVVWGMPGYVTRAGLVDASLPLPKIAPEIERRLSPAPREREVKRAH